MMTIIIDLLFRKDHLFIYIIIFSSNYKNVI